MLFYRMMTKEWNTTSFEPVCQSHERPIVIIKPQALQLTLEQGHTKDSGMKNSHRQTANISNMIQRLEHMCSIAQKVQVTKGSEVRRTKAGSYFKNRLDVRPEKLRKELKNQESSTKVSTDTMATLDFSSNGRGSRNRCTTSI